MRPSFVVAMPRGVRGLPGKPARFDLGGHPNLRRARWVKGEPHGTDIGDWEICGLPVYLMVENMRRTLADVVAHGGEIVQPMGMDTPEITARFRDPGGNVIGLYQERTLVKNAMAGED